MKRRLPLALLTATALAVAALPVAAQGRARVTQRAPRVSSSTVTGGRTAFVRTGARLRSSFVSQPSRQHVAPFPQHVFVPGFGFRPVIHERFPVFGLGFDAHHFHVLHRRHQFFSGGFFGGGFVGTNFFAGGFFPLPFVSSSSSVVVVPQVIPVQVPVPVVVEEIRPPVSEAVAAAGLPADWPRLRIAASSYPLERPRLPQLTLLVLKDHTIFAVTDYWLEDTRIFYVTSTGKQDSVAVRALDWEMTTRLNAERSVTFVLRSER